MKGARKEATRGERGWGGTSGNYVRSINQSLDRHLILPPGHEHWGMSSDYGVMRRGGDEGGGKGEV